MIEQAPSKINKIPYQQWARVVIDNFRQAPDKKIFMRAMREGGVNINNQNITPLDFFSTSPELSDKEIIEAIEGYLEIESLENNLEVLEQSLSSAKNYIQNYRHKKIPKEIQNLKQIKTVNDVIKIFKKTTTLKKGQSLGLAPAYCDLVKTMVAEFEFNKKELVGLVNETEYLYQQLFTTDNDEDKFIHWTSKNETDYDRTVFVDEYSGCCAVLTDSYYRGKNADSFVSKLLQKAEATAAEASKDGIGFKFEVKTKEDTKNLIPILIGQFEKRFSASNFSIENVDLLTEEETQEVQQKSIENYLINLKNKIKELENEIETNERNIKIAQLKDKIKQCEKHPEIAIPIASNINIHSNKNFKALKIAEGKLVVPKNGDEDNMVVSRRFEIQVVLVDNKNESGFSNHNIYEGAKKLAIETRSLGTFTQKYLDIICEEASQKSGISKEKIENYYKENFLEQIVTTPPTQVIKYAVKKTVLRTMKANIFSSKAKFKNN